MGPSSWLVLFLLLMMMDINGIQNKHIGQPYGEAGNTNDTPYKCGKTIKNQPLEHIAATHDVVAVLVLVHVGVALMLGQTFVSLRSPSQWSWTLGLGARSKMARHADMGHALKGGMTACPSACLFVTWHIWSLAVNSIHRTIVRMIILS